MLLKLQTDYALRTLLFLGFKTQRVAVDEVARAYGISRDHLFKVVQSLVRLGYVQSKAGRSGGIRLGRPAAEINVGDVVGHFEGRNGVLPCVTDPDYCNLEPGCHLRHLLIEAERNFFNTLARVTLAELLSHNKVAASGGLYNLSVRGAVVTGAAVTGAAGTSAAVAGAPPAVLLLPEGSIDAAAGPSEREEP